MGELEWIVKMIPQGGAVSSVVVVVSLILLRYIPALLKDQRETVQGIVATHSVTSREERELFRGEMKEIRATFTSALKDVTDALSGRIDGLRDEVHELKDKLEK